MIVRDEEQTLSGCLDSAAGIADEIIIVDTGSTDHTKEVAMRYTDRIYDFEWVEDFAAARNFSFSKADSQFCMWLDADDIIPHKDREELLMLKKNLSPDTDFVMCRYDTGYDFSGKPVCSYYRERLIRNHSGYFWKGAVHETITPEGNILYTDITIAHRKTHASDPQRNLRIFRRKLDSGEPLEPREQFYYARELTYTGEQEEAVRILTAFLDSGKGWKENNIEACRILARCLWSLGYKEKALTALLRSFVYDVPRAELCCDLGGYFMDEKQYQQAAYWYQAAAGCVRNDATGGFVEPDCYGYIPYIQLCLCQELLGNRGRAYEYNEMAGKYKPNGSEYLHNKVFFERQGYGKALENHMAAGALTEMTP